MSAPDDLPLDVYAHVRAALAEEFPLAEILKLEGIRPGSWTAADLAWKKKLSTSSEEFARFEQELTLAEDWLDRDVTPLREDLTAWVAFLDAYLSQPSRFEFVTGLGLRMSDVGRLQRRWDLRMKADRSLEKQAMELRRKPLILPAIQVAEPVLKPSRNAKPLPEPEAPRALDIVSPVEVASEVRGVDVTQLAAITAELSASPRDVEATLRRHGFDQESDYREVERTFKEQFARDPELERDFRRLVAHHEQRLRASSNVAVAPAPMPPPRVDIAPVPRPRLDSTALALNVPVTKPLPFDPTATPSIQETAPEPLPARPRSESLTGTSLGFESPVSPVLPFAGQAGEIASSAPKPALATTAPLLDVPPELRLPFTDWPAEPTIDKPSPEASRPSRIHSGTALAIDEEARRPAEPFATAPAVAPPSRREARLTLEQHASLCVELAMQPQQASPVLARYGLTLEEKAALDAEYKAKVEANPALREAWNSAYQTYYNWLVRERQ
ncbi:MAG: hypothetical protein QM820_59780 [Minicystis sp.]